MGIETDTKITFLNNMKNTDKILQKLTYMLILKK